MLRVLQDLSDIQQIPTLEEQAWDTFHSRLRLIQHVHTPDVYTPKWAEPLHIPCRYKGASGGRSSGKSHWFAEKAVSEMVEDPDLRFVCIREIQRSLKFSAKSLIEGKIKKMGVSHLFTVLEREIRRKGGTGIMIFEGMQDHTSDSIKSLEGFKRAWVEEAQSISQRSLNMLIPTIRAEGSEIWFSWNPDQPTDPVDKFFREGKGQEGFMHVKTTYLDNPRCPEVMRTEAERLKVADYETWEHVWMGGYFLGGSGRVYSMFKNKAWPEGNIDDTVTDLGGTLYIGQDFNVNPMASVIAQRVVDECHILDAWQLETSNTQEVVDRVRQLYPKRHIVFDPDPAGNQRHTNAPVGQTDFTIIRDAGFEIHAPNSHAAIVDRVNNAQAMYYDAKLNRRRVRISPKADPLIMGLANLTYKMDTSGHSTSLRDKKSGFDHICDAADYLLWQEFNVLTLSVWGTSKHST